MSKTTTRRNFMATGAALTGAALAAPAALAGGPSKIQRLYSEWLNYENRARALAGQARAIQDRCEIPYMDVTTINTMRQNVEQRYSRQMLAIQNVCDSELRASKADLRREYEAERERGHAEVNREIERQSQHRLKWEQDNGVTDLDDKADALWSKADKRADLILNTPAENSADMAVKIEIALSFMNPKKVETEEYEYEFLRSAMEDGQRLTGVTLKTL